MATVAHESSESVVIEDPVMIKNVQVSTEAGVVEKTVTFPYCPMTADTHYTFARSHIVFMKALHPNVTKLYKKMVKAFEHDTSDIDDPDEEDTKEDNQSFLIIPNSSKIH